MPLADVCPACGKVSYSFREVRRKVKAANRRRDVEYRGRFASAYRCKGTGWWHFGHLPVGGSNPRRRS